MLNWNEIINRIMVVFFVTTQKELGEALGVSQDLVSNWRKSKAVPTWKTLEGIVMKTGVSWEWLLTGKSCDLPLLLKIYGKAAEHNHYFGKLALQYIQLALSDEKKVITYQRAANICFFLSEYFDQFVDYDGILNNLPQKPTKIQQYDDIANTLLSDDEVGSDLKQLGFDDDAYQMGLYVFTEAKRSYTPVSLQNAINPNARPREPVNFVLEAQGLPVVGKAAADETQGARAGFFPPDPEAHFEQVTIPETTSAVEILGDSMSPVLLDGQYALLGPEYSGQYDQPKNYEIVVVDIEVKDDEQAGSDTHWEGVYCKRIIDAGDIWVFLSINPTGTPFSVAKANCRVWPVIGVWFAGKGKPPED